MTWSSPSKYKNNRVTVDGIRFDSQKEADRWVMLKLMQRAGTIQDLKRQVKFEIIPKQDGESSVSYRADFVYTKDGMQVVEDVKGYKTDVYKIKRKLMLQVHGIRIKEV